MLHDSLCSSCLHSVLKCWSSCAFQHVGGELQSVIVLNIEHRLQAIVAQNVMQGAPVHGAIPNYCLTVPISCCIFLNLGHSCGCFAGAILTKMDGDSRGGAALSVKAVSGKPIKFVGAGEKLEALEPFYPDRLASRILGKHGSNLVHIVPTWVLV